jgi:ergothioneine biosynthesis protein EgtB
VTDVARHPAPAAESAEGLRDQYLAVRGLTERLASPLSPEDQTVQTMPDVSPTKWHRAHTSWFFETFLLGPFLAGYEEFRPGFSYLFNSYYEAVGERYARPDRGFISRPGSEEVARYRRHVDEHVQRLFDAGLQSRTAELVELGIHHEQQHQELLLMDIKHVLSANPLDPVYVPPRPGRTAGSGPASWISHPGGSAEVGHSGGGFAFDNEEPLHAVQLVPFEIADRLVTCGQWQEFMADGGYRRPELWLSDGWAAAQREGWSAPLYWRGEDGGGRDWSVFTLQGRQAVDCDEPVCHVSYYEADAFVRWAGARLPTEFEHEVACSSWAPGDGCLDPDAPHPRPQATGAMFGGAWAWTASAYLPYPGFKPATGAVGEYNAKFMVGQHVLRGGSCATPAGHVRATYRNFFPPSARWPFTGLRLARDL